MFIVPPEELQQNCSEGDVNQISLYTPTQSESGEVKTPVWSVGELWGARLD